MRLRSHLDVSRCNVPGPKQVEALQAGGSHLLRVKVSQAACDEKQELYQQIGEVRDNVLRVRLNQTLDGHQSALSIYLHNIAAAFQPQ
jgi:hypothetical protein